MEKPEDKETIKILHRIFLDKMIRITDDISDEPPAEGKCVSLTRPQGTVWTFQLVLQSGMLYAFVPETITGEFVEGPRPGRIGGRRKIELMPE